MTTPASFGCSGSQKSHHVVSKGLITSSQNVLCCVIVLFVADQICLLERLFWGLPRTLPLSALTQVLSLAAMTFLASRSSLFVTFSLMGLYMLPSSGDSLQTVLGLLHSHPGLFTSASWLKFSELRLDAFPGKFWDSSGGFFSSVSFTMLAGILDDSSWGDWKEEMPRQGCYNFTHMPKIKRMGKGAARNGELKARRPWKHERAFVCQRHLQLQLSPCSEEMLRCLQDIWGLLCISVSLAFQMLAMSLVWLLECSTL